LISKPENRIVLSIEREILTDGHSPLLIIADDFNKYLIKSTRAQSPSYNIINEFICAFMLQLWDIPVPQFASIRLDPELVKGDGFSNFHKPRFYENITFGSKWIENGIEMASYIRIQNKSGLRKFKNPFDLIKIGLFDIWVENTDRKPTNNNILFSLSGNQLTIIAIDHAFTLDSISYSDLNPAYIVNTYNDNILETELAKDMLSIKKKDPDWQEWVRQFEDNYYICIEKCKQNFESIVSFVPNELGFDSNLSKFVHDFLFNESRNKIVFTEFLSRIP
jgi:hypothetical protein